MSPTNSSRTGSVVGGGKYVDNAAADGEGAMLLDRILRSETCVGQQIRERLGLDLRAGTDGD